MINKVYIDLDGVIRAWDQGCIDWFKVPLSTNDVIEWHFLGKYMKENYGVSEKEFWSSMECPEFWLNLPFTPEAPAILELLDKVKAEVVILTSPTLGNAGYSQQWIRNNMPKYFHDKRYILGPDKKYLAYPDALLIDDAEKNIDPWRERGGIGFLYPRPWNRNRKAKDPLLYLEITFDLLDLL